MIDKERVKKLLPYYAPVLSDVQYKTLQVHLSGAAFSEVGKRCLMDGIDARAAVNEAVRTMEWLEEQLLLVERATMIENAFKKAMRYLHDIQEHAAEPAQVAELCAKMERYLIVGWGTVLFFRGASPSENIGDLFDAEGDKGEDENHT